MSKHVVSLVYSRKAGSLLRKSVLAYMADVANHDGTGVWSSKQRIADEIEASKKGVKECVKALLADGLLTEIGKRPCANGYTIEYAINLDVVAELPLMPHNKDDGGNSAPVNPVPPTGAPSSPDGVPQCPQTVLNRPKPTTNVVRAQDAPPPKAKKRKPPPRGASRQTRIPDNWQLTPNDYAFATSKNLTPQEINHEADQFRNHHSAKGSKFIDWSAAWRTWAGNSGKWKVERLTARASRGEGIAAAFARTADQLDAFTQPGRNGQEFHRPQAYADSAAGSGTVELIDADGHVLAGNER